MQPKLVWGIALYMYVYMCIYIYTYIHTYLHKHTHKCMYIQIKHIYIYICISTYINILIREHVCLFVYTYSYTCLQALRPERLPARPAAACRARSESNAGQGLSAAPILFGGVSKNYVAVSMNSGVVKTELI